MNYDICRQKPLGRQNATRDKGPPRHTRLLPFTPPTLFDISTFNHVAQRPTAQPCAAPRLDASRLPVRNHERIREAANKKLLANMAALAA